jgi:hypothetical protein
MQGGPTASFRDPDLYGQTSSTNPKRGSIVSQGTLVVCNVSIVGQWVAEAKSKLKNPGLVYLYYGHSRKRDPVLLAKNSIVVTTYETLSSDVMYHASKSIDNTYCAPCEQVRWWRIICDESHVLRNLNTVKTLSVMKLVADNKWLVSGKSICKPRQTTLKITHLFFQCEYYRHAYQYQNNGPTEPAYIPWYSAAINYDGFIQTISFARKLQFP